MSKEYEGQNPLDIAKQAEQDLNSDAMKRGPTTTAGQKTGTGSTSTDESGIDQSVTSKFPGSTAEYGSQTSGAGSNRDIPPEEGGGFHKGTGRMTKAGDFDQGEAGEGPEDIARRAAEDRGGDNDVVSNTK